MPSDPAYEPETDPSGERSIPVARERSGQDIRLDPPEDVSPPPRPLVEVALLVGLSILLLIDLADDAGRVSVAHLAVEVSGAVFALAAAIRLWLRWRSAHRALQLRVHHLRGALSSANEDAARWRAEAHQALAGLGAAIDRQCDRWGLTEAERAVAVLLLKGLSMKEIAELRGTAERTTRQQALSVYKKAGLTGRAELAAFFLEDLLLPSAPPAPRS